jgi:HAE1 family hydrophobic/amphiphilic exporter-1
MVMVNTPEASSLQTTEKAILGIDSLIRKQDAVLDTSFAAGYNLLAGIASTNSGVIFVALKPYNERKQSAMQLADLLNKELYTAAPEATCYAFIPPSIPGLGIASGVSVEVQDLAGRGTSYLARQTDQLIAALEKEPSISTVTTQFNDGIPQRRLEVDREQALAMGVDLGTLYGDMSALLGGRYIDNFTRFGRLYQTYLQAAPDYRQNRRALDSYFVNSTSNEEPIPLSTLVELVDTVGVSYVSQFNLYRSISLNITPAKGASTATVMERIEAVSQEILPDDVGTSWSGVSFQEAAEEGKGLWVYAVTLLFAFLALAALYESWGLPMAILLSVPIAVLGAVGSVALTHLIDPIYVNDIYLQISLVMLIGLAAKNAILVVEYADKLFHERHASLLDAAMEAARLRLRPILMTAFSFILGVLPLIFASGVYATARNIMGVALVGGMVCATLLGIFLYPALYYLIGRLGGFEKRQSQNTTQA